MYVIQNHDFSKHLKTSNARTLWKGVATTYKYHQISSKTSNSTDIFCSLFYLCKHFEVQCQAHQWTFHFKDRSIQFSFMIEFFQYFFINMLTLKITFSSSKLWIIIRYNHKDDKNSKIILKSSPDLCLGVFSSFLIAGNIFSSVWFNNFIYSTWNESFIITFRNDIHDSLSILQNKRLKFAHQVWWSHQNITWHLDTLVPLAHIFTLFSVPLKNTLWFGNDLVRDQWSVIRKVTLNLWYFINLDLHGIS